MGDEQQKELIIRRLIIILKVWIDIENGVTLKMTTLFQLYHNYGIKQALDDWGTKYNDHCHMLLPSR